MEGRGVRGDAAAAAGDDVRGAKRAIEEAQCLLLAGYAAAKAGGREAGSVTGRAGGRVALGGN
jgi:hypothetical protein